jgi:hypothetical protein
MAPSRRNGVESKPISTPPAPRHEPGEWAARSSAEVAHRDLRVRFVRQLLIDIICRDVRVSRARWGTLMRYFFIRPLPSSFPIPVPLLARRSLSPSFATHAISSRGLTLFLESALRRATAGTIDVAAVAPWADPHLAMTPRAVEEAIRVLDRSPRAGTGPRAEDALRLSSHSRATCTEAQVGYQAENWASDFFSCRERS